MKKRSLLLLVVAVLGGCKKEQVPAAPSRTDLRTDLLTAHNWLRTAWTIPNGSTAPTDMYATLSVCDRALFFQFRADHTFVTGFEPTRCSGTAPATHGGTWSFNGDQSVLTLTSAPGYANDNAVVELSATTLLLRYSQTSVNTTNTGDVTFTAY